MSTSIVVVTHNRPLYLRLTLLSLLRQTKYPNEVIVIDDASNPPILESINDIIDEYKQRGIRIRILRTRREIGLGAARGLGAQIALSRYIVFVDDDIIASRRLVEEYVSSFEKNKCDIVAGPCYPKYVAVSQKPPSWWDDRILGGLVAVRNDLVYLRGARNPADYVYGCNFAVSKQVLETIKGFKPWLGRVKATLLSGEEWDLVTRAIDRGFKACFNVKAYAYHLVTPLKLSIRRIWKMGYGLAKTRCVLSYESTFYTLRKYLMRSYIAIIRDVVLLLKHMLRNENALLIDTMYNLIVRIASIITCKNTINSLNYIKVR